MTGEPDDEDSARQETLDGKPVSIPMAQLLLDPFAPTLASTEEKNTKKGVNKESVDNSNYLRMLPDGNGGAGPQGVRTGYTSLPFDSSMLIMDALTRQSGK